MEFDITTINSAKCSSPCIIVGVFSNQTLSSAAQLIDEASQGFLSKILSRGDLEGKIGQTLMLFEVPGIQAERVLLCGCGEANELNSTKFRDLQTKAVAILNEHGIVDAVCYLAEVTVTERDLVWKLRQAVTVAKEVNYRFNKLKSKTDNSRRTLKQLSFAVPESQTEAAKQALNEGQALAKGVAFMKDLANLPSNHCTPTFLADQAEDLAKHYQHLKVKVLDEKDMSKLGMNTLLSVARGSHEEPKFIILEYKGNKSGSEPIVLVGKGVTFDTGGISIKPAASMDEMKFDMSGAASVLGTLKAVAEMALPLNVVGLIPATENMPGGKATKPGDIVTSLSGQTVEILNTDAEGRLILCDALTYAERYKPALVIDIATLTGACVVALGSQASAVMGNNDELIDELIAAGNISGDRIWPLPLWEEYQKGLDSPFADMANISGNREAGSIIGGCFLARFTKAYKWAHLDIAGTAYRGGAKKGSTGRPVPLLVQFLLHRCKA